MSKLKLIYISHCRLTDKIARDWYIDSFCEKGAVIEYWDIVGLVREEHEDAHSLDVNYLKILETYNEFESLICQPENKNAVYVMLITYSGKFSKPFRLLSKYNCKMVFLNWGAQPSNDSTPRLYRVIKRLLSNPTDFITQAFDVLLSYLYRKLNLVKKFDIVFTAGSALTSVDQYAKKLIPINLCDYDHYCKAKASDKRLVREKYVVFLDINLPYQSDLAIYGVPSVTPFSYFNSLNRFFDLLEEAFGIKVVIAAHPKAFYSKDEYKQREIHRLSTAALVKDAEFVITHTSTALSYAVLNLKPILFIYTSEMNDIYKNTVMKEIKAQSSYFNVAIINIDEITNGNQINIQSPNHNRYELYKYTYLTSFESENLSSAEIFYSNIASL